MTLVPWREAQKPFNNNVTLASQEHASKVFPQESVGFVVDDEYIPMENIHEDPENHYKVDPNETVKYADKIQAIIHSHNMDVHPGHPSKADMITQDEWGIPFGIQLINSAGVGNIVWWGDTLPIPEYEDRPYIYGVYDCFSIFRDYYRHDLGITLPIFPREDGFWNRGEQMYKDNALTTGFVQVERTNLQVNDVVLIRIKSQVANHAILYLGGDYGLHHMPYRNSRFDTVSKFINPNRAMFDSVWRYQK